MAATGTGTQLRRAWYAAAIADFTAASSEAVLGALAAASPLDITPEQSAAWLEEIAILQAALAGLAGTVYLEFAIPRMGHRADAIVLAGGVVFVLEFKSGPKFLRADLDQVWDYALDLKNFHAGSHAPPVVPVLVATAALSLGPAEVVWATDGVPEPLGVNPGGLRPMLDRLCAEVAVDGVPLLDAGAWAGSPYRPTPTIIEAARALYANHSVEEIARSDAEARNLAVTSGRVRQLMETCRAEGRKAIGFITGVPGAGKTLVGLGLAAPGQGSKPHGVYLSGNGPLVRVLVEALARDGMRRSAAAGETKRKGDARREAKLFIQNVHHYRDALLQDPRPPHEHIAIFDEAQRAWGPEELASFMKRKKGQEGFSQSESELFISGVDRHQDWALIVCLVGGGQEINRGEAGLGEWLRVLSAHFKDWEVYLPPGLGGSEYRLGGVLAAIEPSRLHLEPELHLAVSMRSFRSEAVSEFVRAALASESALARDQLARLARYPIVLCRNLETAKSWLRRQARASERRGLLVSSKAYRLKPHAIDVRAKIDPVHWFLDPGTDTRSSNFLEDAGTEFDVQGLELDWACVAWDGDLRWNSNGWDHFEFRGDRWQRIQDEARKRFQLNAYRVLLTRARQGMVLCIPRGQGNDATRQARFYDPTFEYFAGLGLEVLH